MAVEVGSACSVCGECPSVVVLGSGRRLRYIAVALCAHCARTAGEAAAK